MDDFFAARLNDYGWIDAAKTPPPSNGEYQVWFRSDTLGVNRSGYSEFKDGLWGFDGNKGFIECPDDKITHWRPMPAGPAA